MREGNYGSGWGDGYGDGSGYGGGYGDGDGYGDGSGFGYGSGEDDWEEFKKLKKVPGLITEIRRAARRQNDPDNRE